MKYCKFAWCLTSGAILAYVLTFHDGPHVSERDVILIYCMLVMSFPLGLAGSVFPIALSALNDWLELNVLVNPLRNTVLAWLLLVSIGYIQWFITVPWMLKRLKSAKKAKP